MGHRLCYTNYTNMETISLSKIMRVGSSLCVVIPKPYLTALKWQRGDIVILGATQDNILKIRLVTDLEIKQIKDNVVT